MTGILRVFRYEFMRTLRRKGYLAMSLGVPIAAIVIFFAARAYYAAQANTPQQNTVQTNGKLSDSILPTGIVDKTPDGSFSLPPDLFKNVRMFKSQDAATAALQNHEVSAYWVIDQDYIHNGKIDLYFAQASLSGLNSDTIRGILVESLINKTGGRVDARFADRLNESQLHVTSQILNDSNTIKTGAGEGVSTVLVYVFGLTLVFASFATSGYLMQSVVEEKANRMVEVLISSVRPSDLLGGKTLAYGLLGMIQMACWGLAIAYIVSQLVAGAIAAVQIPITFSITTTQIVFLIVYFILGFMLFASVFAIVGAISTSMREGPQMAGFILIPAMIPFYFIESFATAPDGPLSVGLSIFPITAPMGMVMRLALQEVPIPQLAISLLLLVLTIAGLIWVAARAFRVNILLSGQLPKLSEIPRLIFEKG
jgi:ABC-2 type transport system permease protein